MRKNLTIIIVIYYLIIWAGSISLAQSKEISVVSDDWVYQDMAILNQSKLLANYPIDWVRAGKKLFRLEIAYYIKQLVLDSLKNQNIKNQLLGAKSLALQRLVKEFQAELSNLGIKTTDIAQISLSPVDYQAENDGYLDLDQVVKIEKPNDQEPYYYYGQYYSNLVQKNFLFIPTLHIRPEDYQLFDKLTTKPTILYQPELDNKSFLAIKGNLPLNDTFVDGYYLFPISDNLFGEQNFSKQKILELLDEINQIKQVNQLWRINGLLWLEGFLQFANDFTRKIDLENFQKGIKVGGLLVYSEAELNQINLEPNRFGLPSDNTIKPLDLDNLTPKNIQALQINIQGSLPLTPQASLYGGLDLLYRDFELPREDFWPSDTKASAGLSYQFDNYWTLSTYQSLVNFHQKENILSTTSLGVNYHDWITLWLAYQLVSFKDPVLQGTISINF